MMRRWHFFNLSTGEFADRVFQATNDRDLKRATPEGCGAIEGRFDPLTQRVDVDNRVVVQWSNAKRIDELAAAAAAVNARAAIAKLESSQMRAIREDRLRPSERGPGGKTPRERLQEIDDEIAILRAALSDGKDTSEP